MAHTQLTQGERHQIYVLIKAAKMNIETLREHVTRGEDSARQFKVDVKNGGLCQFRGREAVYRRGG